MASPASRDGWPRDGSPGGSTALIGGSGVGYLLGWAIAPTSTTVVNLLLALLSGFNLYNVFSDELPGDRRLRFPVFAASAAGYAIVLVAVVAAG